MKKLFSTLLISFIALATFSQGGPYNRNKLTTNFYPRTYMLINDTSGTTAATSRIGADSSAVIIVRDTTRGVLLPRMTGAQAAAISDKSHNLLVVITDSVSNPLCIWDTLANRFRCFKTTISNDSIAKYAWTLNGNTGLDTSNFAGTIDSVPFNMRSKNINALMIDPYEGTVVLQPDYSILDLLRPLDSDLLMAKITAGFNYFHLWDISDNGWNYLLRDSAGLGSRDYGFVSSGQFDNEVSNFFRLKVGRNNFQTGTYFENGISNGNVELSIYDDVALTDVASFQIFRTFDAPYIRVALLDTTTGNNAIIKQICASGNVNTDLKQDADTLSYTVTNKGIYISELTSNFNNKIVTDTILVRNNAGAGKVLTSDATGNAIWETTSFTSLDSVSIYALTPDVGTTYLCTDCTGNGVTGRVVSFFGAAWRRLLFE